MIDYRIIHNVINSTSDAAGFVDKFFKLDEVGAIEVPYAHEDRSSSPNQIQFDTKLKKCYKKRGLLKLLYSKLKKGPDSIKKGKEKNVTGGKKQYFMLNYNFPENTGQERYYPVTVVHLKLYNNHKDGFFSTIGHLFKKK